MEVRTYHDGLCDLLATNVAKAMWVIMDQLTKSAHFLVVRMTFTLEEFCRIYIREIVQLHGVLVLIVSDRDPRFMAHFWKSF